MNDFDQTDLETINLTIEDAQSKIARMEALERLENIQDFKDIVSEGLCETEAIRLVRATAFPGNRNNSSQELLASRINMIGELQMYFVQIKNEGRAAKAALQDHYNTRDEILEEESSAMRFGKLGE